MNMKTRITKTVRRITSLVLLLALSCSMVLPTLAVSSKTFDDILFDASYYAAANPDVVKALGSSTSALRNHYESYGKKEGRAPSDLFDPKFYLNSYPDLKAAFSSNYQAAYNHFVSCGISEGRQGSAKFSLTTYKNNYADLRQAFGTSSSNNWKYLQHWAQYGRKEGRVANASITSSASSSSTSTASTAAQTTVKYVKTSSTSNSLYMRSGPSTSYGIVTKLSYGTKVQVLSTTGSWSKVTANGKTGYVSSQYLTSTDPKAAIVSVINTGSKTMSAALYGTSGGYISCGFDGYKNTSGRHEGIDFYRGYGASVYSLTDGVITRVTEGYNGSNGLSTIAIYSASTGKTVIYLHADPLNSLYVGQSISRGQKIATEAWRGVSKSSGTHTHVEVRNGRCTSAAKSVNDYKLDNPNPTSFWNSLGYQVK